MYICIIIYTLFHIIKITTTVIQYIYGTRYLYRALYIYKYADICIYTSMYYNIYTFFHVVKITTNILRIPGICMFEHVCTYYNV